MAREVKPRQKTGLNSIWAERVRGPLDFALEFLGLALGLKRLERQPVVVAAPAWTGPLSG